MLLRIVNWLISWAERKGRVINITGTAEDTDVYLIRYFIFRNKWFNVYIHRFLRSDRDDLHDHPWNFCTLLLKGYYFEHRDNGQIVLRTPEYNYFVTRKATDLHKVVLGDTYSLEEKDKAPLTLFMSGPKIREWGFIKNGKWTDWREYLGLPKDTPSRG